MGTWVCLICMVSPGLVSKARTIISMGLGPPVSIPLAFFQTLPSRPFGHRGRRRGWLRRSLLLGFLLFLFGLFGLFWVFFWRSRLLGLGFLLLLGMLLLWRRRRHRRRRCSRGRSGRRRGRLGNSDGNPVNWIPSYSSGYKISGIFAFGAMRFHVVRRHIGQWEVDH